ncbi:hypothetical protein K493DRAFT_316181 [Basidiobolus meristosporus CBS 931.73]|uniref:CigA protein n=1 Tax=Basidiobolus meristosporus CBS 931.73 TaxID=1314790 RepID=A0A1Y1Y534_9FUNG|nr:hypothetical protein K493DRAFT_316181 [Basidiobolus meristosporus CBS 931.73]|eukprot:ORX93098.1 hypothetical protein K493DRAFT_316181 [Basidiobolus meristosporus CBS 931.73]
MSISSLQKYGIDPQQDIYFLKDTALYDYRIFDHFPEGYVVGKYQRKIMVSDLQKIPDKLLHIGSIFGNLRVTTLQHKSEYKHILDSLQFTNPGLKKVSQAIVDQLGGRGKYLGIHLRVGDGNFSYKVEENAHGILELLTQMLAMTGRGELGGQLPDRYPSLSQCLNQKPMISPIVYLATDARNPRERLDFASIFTRFPCTFVLNDFANALAETDEVNPWDGSSISKYLIPMVDAVTAANGEFYVGTNQSTFSMYVRRMHNHYLGRPDPLNLKY